MGLRTPLLAKLQLDAVQQQEGSPTVRGLISTNIGQVGKVDTGNSRFPVLTSTTGRRSATGYDLSCGRGQITPASGRPWLSDSLRQVERMAE